ncbi:Rox3 mediator complex subunit protein [Rutstroemia sp. NJR-2017a WRK4]|nr:Rox3 mediator complex subunit protein [Rutstroemia sp. NJR-2017a WRK4]PQE11873.1 Rox3 mediator complex subunit protein [Rutstroemia sp. NJR-2017a WRK4]
MPFDLPQTPQSPSYTPSATDSSSKATVSPRINTSLPTPAHSINGSMSSLNSAVEVSQPDDLSNKRKRDVEDHGDRDQKKVHVEDSRLSINDLHQEVGQKYLLCRTQHPPLNTSVSQDLFDRFALNDIAASVARLLPDGKKNVIRKTYKGYIKSLGISGQFDAVRQEWEEDGSLFSLVNPEGPNPTKEIWEANHVRGQEIDKGLSDTVRSSLGRAMTMARGTIPKERWNSSVLGELGAANVDPSKQAATKAKAPIMQGATSIPKANKAAAAAGAGAGAADIARPKRSVKKRTYGDASYEGYGEGYIDDDAGYSTGDGDDRAGGRKRPKKVGSLLYLLNIRANKQKTPTHSFQGPMRQSYGPGMVGA